MAQHTLTIKKGVEEEEDQEGRTYTKMREKISLMIFL